MGDDYKNSCWLDQGRLGSRTSPIGAICAITLGLFPVTVIAQDNSTALPASAQCSAITSTMENAAAPGLQLSCDDEILFLGIVDNFQIVGISPLAATVVDTWRDGRRRIWLVEPGPDGRPKLEELTGAIANAADRGTTANLRDLTIDMEQVPSGGAIRLGPDGAASLDLAQVINQSRTSAAAAEKTVGQQ